MIAGERLDSSCYFGGVRRQSIGMLNRYANFSLYIFATDGVLLPTKKSDE